MKYVFVGDIHGRVDDVERALARDGFKVFVGDFVDSFDQSINRQRKCLDLVLEAIERGEAASIYGNHELSYLRKHHQCSGWNVVMNGIIQSEYRERIERLFVPFWYKDGILATHAGLTNKIANPDRFDITPENVERVLTPWWFIDSSPMHWIGAIRGGPNDVGGTFWCHYPNEFEPIPGLVQVFGHTAGTDIRGDAGGYCIDNSRRQLGDMDFLTIEV